jgi:alkane 1-monooxygenase
VCLSLGVCGGFGIVVAHELMHRRGAGDRALAEIMMSSVSYPHFCVEHVYGHHRKVATREDAASSRFGEHLYAFLPRTLWTSLRSFWEIETTIVGRKKLRRGSLRDRRVRYAMNLAAAYSVIGLLGGWAAVATMAVVGAVAALVLETINYLEHYGLEREQTENGRYERVRPHHSWNSAHRLSSYFMFGLVRHSDHHYLASRQYPVLRHHGDAPQLPFSYGTMFLVALVPPLWHRIMDPRVLAVRAGETPARAAVSASSAPTKPTSVSASAA